MYTYYIEMLKTGEKSDRVLKLTAEILKLNVANYSIWYI